jgi:hypothetical protein
MADFASLQQEIDQIWGYTRQAREYNWMARARTILMRQEVQRVYRRKPRQNIVYVSAERSRPCWTNVTHRIYTCGLSRFEGPLLCTMWL